ncbi:Aste57867_22160 [Aphanomyces stellatus]|uniref:Katanin p80 WD40 repeat-containing subunit B1 homolog n=1 Tax=Aphanomyces stellatus TaxID=120398 RepID=A0A485LKS8_9STRA|nr:hypothetical protein As57867_022091 [Aphanomyces stellatus]VFT98827.1 Aste57867_22160 [Aphanomyces stellatus]
MAHSSNVNCFRFGKKSGQVAVSGGDDTNVNLWRIRENETKNIMSLAGHSSPVECVIFDPSEKRVVAGSKSGAIKAYDMESAKVYRTLKGHMSNCTTIDYHLYGDYVASGALDTNVKIWDLKSKNCVQTFKGHTNEVTCVGFTPDGRWLTSGSADGSLKIWDLTAGKLLKEFSDHDGAITSLDFNPEEYILVSAASDKTIRFWDLQEFELLGLTPIDNTITTCISHTISEPYSGKYAVCSSHDAIKVWSYDTSVHCHDTLAWNNSPGASERLGDTLVTDNLQLFGGSFTNAFISIWRVDLTQLQPFAPKAVQVKSRQPTPSGPRDQPHHRAAPSQHHRAATPPSSSSVGPPAAKPRVDETSTSTQMGPDTIKRFAVDNGSTSRRPSLECEPIDVLEMQGLHVDDDISNLPPPGEYNHPPPTVVDPVVSNADYVKELRCGMEVSMRTFRTRQKCLEQFLTYWDKGDVHGGFRYLAQLAQGSRESVTNDVLASVDLASIGLDLEACVLLLPLASELIAAAFDSYIKTGIAVAKLLFTTFSPLVKENREARRSNREVNFASEDRALRCDACHQSFLDLQTRTQTQIERGPPQSVARDLQEFRALLAEYCWTP